jgi:glutamate--cysteine ligase
MIYPHQCKGIRTLVKRGVTSMDQAYAIKQERIISLIKQGETPSAGYKIGVEIEHIVVDSKTLKTIDYFQENGIESILKALVDQGYEPITEAGNVVGLLHEDYIITLEPGGQIEISINALAEIADIQKKYDAFLSDIIPILEQNHQWMLCIGYHPKSSIKEIPFNPKKRYQYMSDYFKKTGKYGHYMMKGTASLQVVIDYQDEEDFIKKLRAAHLMMPFVALMTDNAPFFEGEPAPQTSMRTAIWDHTDPARCGLIPGVMDQRFGYSAYADYILRTPPIIMLEEARFVETGSRTTENLAGFEQFSDAQVDHILSMVFPDVRVRRYIEIRMADSLPMPYNFAFVALIKGLFYFEPALQYLYHLSLGFTDQKLRQLRNDIQIHGYEADINGATCQQMLLTILDLAKQGISDQEKEWLTHFESLVQKKETPAAMSRTMVRQQGYSALEWCAVHHAVKEG